jgi:hypothetical protein
MILDNEIYDWRIVARKIILTGFILNKIVEKI